MIILETYFPSIAKNIRFRAIRQISLHEFKERRLFEPELKIMKELLKDEVGICLDIGAHVGEYCYAFEQFMTSSRIHAFEPNAETCKKLRAFFPKIRVWNYALSDIAGTALFTIPTISGRKYATRGTLENISEPNESERETLEVKTMTLDAFDSEVDEPICFLKIDTEGHELKILAGGKEVIQKYHPIMLIEIEHRHHKESMEDIFREIEGLGYSGYFLDLQEWKFSPIAIFNPNERQRYERLKSIDYVNNFLFLPDGRADSILGKLEKWQRNNIDHRH